MPRESADHSARCRSGFPPARSCWRGFDGSLIAKGRKGVGELTIVASDKNEELLWPSIFSLLCYISRHDRFGMKAILPPAWFVQSLSVVPAALRCLKRSSFLAAKKPNVPFERSIFSREPIGHSSTSQPSAAKELDPETELLHTPHAEHPFPKGVYHNMPNQPSLSPCLDAAGGISLAEGPRKFRNLDTGNPVPARTVACAVSCTAARTTVILSFCQYSCS